MERLIKIGKLKSKHALEVQNSRLGVGFEKLDRDAFDPEKAYDKVAELGVKWVRIQSGWAKTEKEKGVYDFSWLDKVVDNLIARGLRPWICLCYGNGLYSDEAKKYFGAAGVAPTSGEYLEAWKAYVYEVVSHFKDRIHEWEVWNEPDGAWCWKSGPDGTEYGKFVVDTAKVIREAYKDAYIIGGSVCKKYVYFLNAAFMAGMGECIDGLTFHEYTRDEVGAIQTIKVYKAIADMYNDKIEIIQGESGSQSKRNGAGAVRTGSWTERKQAKQLLRHAMVDLLGNVKFTSYFSAMDMMEGFDYKPGEKISKFGYFGLLAAEFDENGCATGEYKEKLSYYVMQNLASVFSDEIEIKNLPIMVQPQHSELTFSAEPRHDEIIQGGFKIGDNEIYVFWIPSNLMTTDYEGTFTIASALMKEVHLVDFMDGSVYSIPDTMKEEGVIGADIYSSFPIRDYPMALIFGDITKYI
ncbi:MAG: beta-galactosidase [Lachnospiraceae bacterium]|nr:beta-galactosidase [Lachnospiraceae bacterium]